MTNRLLQALAAGLLAISSVAMSLCAGEVAVRGLDQWRSRSGPKTLDELTALARESGVSADTLNAYYLGESSMVGVPYDPRLSIPRLVEHYFDGTIDGRPLRSVNLARSGQDLAFNAERLELVLENPSVFHPGLVVIYLGHNEFLKLNRPYLIERDGVRWWQRGLARSLLLQRLEDRLAVHYPLDLDERALFDRPEGSPVTVESIVDHFEARLGALVDAARERSVPVVLATVASNLADFEPSRSVYCGPEAQRDEFAAKLEAGLAASRLDADDAALARFDEARAICGRFAELEFRRARILERRGLRAEASAAYRAAVDADATPLRGGSRINGAIRRVAATRGIAVVDVDARFAALGPRPEPGYEWFVDAHHPSAASYAWIARDVAERIRATLGVQAPLVPLAPEEVETRFHLDAHDFVFEKLVERGRWFSRIATLRWDPVDRLARAEAAFREAAQREPGKGDPRLGLAIVAYLRRDVATGDREVAAARALEAERSEAYLATPWVRAVVTRARVASDETAGEHAGPDALNTAGLGEARPGR